MLALSAMPACTIAGRIRRCDLGPNSSDIGRSAQLPTGAKVAFMENRAYYLNYPRRGLTVTLKADWWPINHCPRCIASGHPHVELFTSRLPTVEHYATTARLRPSGKLARTHAGKSVAVTGG
jgi:hypothetical protein